MIKANVAQINGQIQSVCDRIKRNADEIILVGITKYAEVPQINSAIAAGIKHIGENKVQEAVKKFSQLDPNLKIIKHMVGHLQTNKAKQAIEIFDLIESVDSLKLAGEINKHAEKIRKRMNILVQVNVAGEEQKYGLSPDEVEHFFDGALNFDFVNIQGLMTIAPLTEDAGRIRRCFSSLYKIFEKISGQTKNDSRIDMTHLSMGMSGDYKIAVEEGSNMLRIGSAIFHGE